MQAVLIVAVVGVVLLSIERVRPGRELPRVPGWLPRALLANAVQVGVVLGLSPLWDAWMLERRVLDLESLGVVPGATLGYLAITFVYYWWHRARHEVPWLWRGLHQMHHSPRRLEVITSFYKHPLEIGVNGVLSSAILYGIGLGPAQAAVAVLATGVAELVYHWNVSTPRWMGLLFQRPEMHCVHHEEGRHTSNFSDLPLWDLMFGTYSNPARFEARCGFADGAERRVWDLLRGVDVESAGRGTGVAA